MELDGMKINVAIFFFSPPYKYTGNLMQLDLLLKNKISIQLTTQKLEKPLLFFRRVPHFQLVIL